MLSFFFHFLFRKMEFRVCIYVHMCAPVISYESRQLHTQVTALTKRQGSLALILSFAYAKIEARLRSFWKLCIFINNCKANIIILLKILQFSKIYLQCFLQHVMYLQLSVVFKPTPLHYYQAVSNTIFNLRKIHFMYILCFKYKTT